MRLPRRSGSTSSIRLLVGIIPSPKLFCGDPVKFPGYNRKRDVSCVAYTAPLNRELILVNILYTVTQTKSGLLRKCFLAYTAIRPGSVTPRSSVIISGRNGYYHDRRLLVSLVYTQSTFRLHQLDLVHHHDLEELINSPLKTWFRLALVLGNSRITTQPGMGLFV